MFDLQETDLKPGSGKPAGVTPDRDARARAMAIETGMKWKCGRVGEYVNITDCVTRYTAARHARPRVHCPCLECSSVAAHLRKFGISPTPIPQPQPQEPVEMATPAKKLEVVQQKPEAVNPFANWERFDRNERPTGESFVTLTVGRVLSFSKNADVDLDLEKYNSVDIFANKTKLGLAFHIDSSGTLALTKHGANRTISSRGLCKAFALDYLVKKRLPVREVAPGFVEVDLSTEVVES